MPLEKIEQHVETGLLKLPPRLWGLPRVGAGLASLLREIQTLEDAIWAQFEAQHVETAGREALLVMAKLIGMNAPAGTFSVEGLRTAIKARALANRSRGRGPDIGRVLVALLGADGFYFTWAEPASIYITALDNQSAEEVLMAQTVLPYATAAGVGVQFGFSGDADNFLRWGSGVWGQNFGSVRAI